MEQKTELAIVNPNEYGIEEKTATELTQGLAVPLEERKPLIEEFEIVSKLEITPENISEFKTLRLKIQKNRTQGIEAWHKAGKEYFLRGGQFVDAIKRKEVLINKQMEDKLKEGEDFFENQELERVAKLQNERVERIAKYVEDAHERDYTRFDEGEFEDLLAIKKKAYEDKLAEEARIEAERIEAERLEAERLEKQRLENIKLKKEAEEREKALAKERAEAIAKQKAIEEKAKKEREKIEAENAKKLKEEQDAKAKLQAEIDAKNKAEADAKQAELDRIEAEKKEKERLAKAPIKEKLNVWVDSFEIKQNPITEPTTTKTGATAVEIINKFEAFKLWAKKEIEKL